jgi:pseudouridine-5'-phosphate glycosidase
MHNFLLLSPEVAAARTAGKPIVALESTIISHGMPYPQNVRTAREVEQIIRDAGAVPATIAVIAGKICIGLSDEQLELLGSSPDAMKVSRRDLAYVLAQARLGATTVAATMICAQLAGIEVFVTGGIGGVHRGAETSFDISADLQELAQTSVAVVCAGVKSILDIGLRSSTWKRMAYRC